LLPLIISEDFDMKHIFQWLSHSHLMQMLLSTLFVMVIFFANSLPVIAGSSDPTQGTVKLDEIQQKTQEAIDAPAMSLKSIEERSKGGLNEVQGDADYGKMIDSNDAKLPVVEKAEEAIDKAKAKSKR
jgi:hypothetical protein